VNKVTGQEVHAIHRDVSPQNLLLNYDGNLKVIDFGIAKAASGLQEATRAGTIKGKYSYLSPEQVDGRPVDARADIFALGIVAWELLTLRLPFFRDGDSELTILGTISNCDHHIKAPSFYNCEIPTEVDQLVLKALRKNPDERFASAAEFQAACRQLLQKHYPEYSYAESGRMMQSLFADEILRERQEIRQLNMQAQMSLSNADATVVTSAGGVVGTLKAVVPNLDMDLRLREIELLMKKKASTRHYVMFAFYLFSVVALKLDDSYNIFESLFSRHEAVDVAANDTTTKRAPALTLRHAGPHKNKHAAKKAVTDKTAATPSLATQDEAE
jgi:serine/threonine protein kinase